VLGGSDLTSWGLRKASSSYNIDDLNSENLVVEHLKIGLEDHDTTVASSLESFIV